ncbi:oligosaccharide flippase family protein [Anaerocaecibacter muris]|uniref:oligosaccharide flippase family protein n=1 Tax=Anaerocaecibacter muris TaxID=2941513 RepID=UPI003F68E833
MKSLAKAVITLTAFTVAERMLGFLFKIYLSREIGAVGMGIYSVALSFFFVLLTLLTSGVPLVVSKLTAKDKSIGGKICSAALIFELITAVVVCSIVLAFQKPIGALFAESQSMTLVMIMLPALVFSGVYSAFRGVLWGEKKFTTVSVAELIEQIARIVCCVVLFGIFKDKIKAVALSMTVACLVSAIAVALFYFIGKRKIQSPKGHIKPLITTSLPITFSRTTSSVNNYIIAIAVPFLLMTSGLNSEQSMYIFGSCVGMALPLLYLPITVVGSLAFVMIPTLSEAYAHGDKKSMCRQIESALSFSVIVAAVILPAYAALGGPLGTFIYNNTDAGIFLKKSAWLLLPLSFENIASSMLNSLDLEKKSLINYLIGAATMYIICFAFYSRFNIDVFMIAFGVSLIVSSVLDVIDIKRRTGIKLSFFRPLLICLAAAYPAWLFTDYVFSIIPGTVLPIIIAGIGGVSFSALAAVVFGAIDFDVTIGKTRKKRKLSRRKAKVS